MLTVAHVTLAGLLAVMAIGQVISWRDFAPALVGYGLSRPVVWARGIVVAEAAAAILLLVESTEIAGAVLALVVALLWSGLAVRAFLQRRSIKNCGCFGGFLAQPLRWWVLLEDVAFIALPCWILYRALRT